MKHPEYTVEQAEFMNHVQQKVAAFFDAYPVTAHGFEHVSRVARHAQDIALHESPKDTFLAELAGWLHDIGRVPEHFHNPLMKTHHELSYDLIKEWMREDVKFYMLSDAEKLELLYSVRYHWNNAADKYFSAVILRDADKLDALGKIGLERGIAYAEHDEEKINLNLRFTYDIAYHIQTARAKQIIEERDLMAPIDAYYDQFLRSKIEPVTLT